MGAKLFTLKMKSVAGPLAGLLLLAGGMSAAEALELVQPGTLQIVTTGNAPPLSLTQADGTITGFDVELCREIARRLELEPVVSRLEFSAILPGLAAGRYDIVCSSTARTAARLASPDILMSEPTIENFTSLVVRTDSGIDSVENVSGLRIGVVRGGQEKKAVEIYYGDKNTTVEYPGLSEEILDLKNKRIDAVAANAVVASYYVADDADIKVITPGLVVEGMSPYSLGLIVNAKAPELGAKVNELLAAMHDDGSFEELRHKWVALD